METGGNSVAAGNGNEKKPNLFNDCRAWKLINDPFLRRGLPKLYRFDGICPQVVHSIMNSAYNVQYISDPRTVLPTRYWGGREHIDLPVPVFQIDDNCFGHLPAREVSFFDLNDNISPAFLADLCKKCGDYEELKIYYHPVDKRHLGIGRVIFRKVKYAKVCIDKHNGTPIMGKIVQVVLDPFGKRVKKTFHDLSTADSSTATTSKDNVALANQNRLSNSVASSNLAASSQHYVADGNSSVSTPHNTASVIPEDPISQQHAPVPVSSAQVYEYPNNCASGMPPIQAGYATWQPQACWPQIQTAAWPGAQPTWPTMPYANFCGAGALPPFPQQQSVAPLYENVDNAGAACWSAPPRPSSQPGVGDETKKKERKPDAGKPNGANIYSTNNNNEKSSKSKDKCTPDKKRSEKSSSSTTTKYYEHDSASGRKTTRQREHQTVEKRVFRLTTKLYRTSLHRDRSPFDERRKYSTSRKNNVYSKERDSHRRHRSFKSRSRDRDVDRSTSLSSKRDRHRSRGDDRYTHRSESRSSKRDFKPCVDGLESLSSDSIMSDDDALRRKAKDNFRKEEHRKSEERKNCSKKNETPPKSQHHSNSSKHRDKETMVVVESANQNLSVAKKDNCKSADDDDKMSLSSGSSRPSSRIATQEKPNLPTVLPPPQQMLPVAPYFNALPPNIYNPYDPNVYTAMMCAAMAVYGMPPTGQQHQSIMGPMQPQMSQHMPVPWSMPNVVDYQQPPVDRPTELPVLVDYSDPNIIRKLTLETSDRVVEHLKFVLNKDIWKKLVENSAFKSLDVWFQTQEKVNDILKPKSDSPEKSASTTSSAVCSTTVSSSLSRLFGQENSSTNSSSSFSQLFGLGLRASMPKLPSFKRKPVELSPSRRHREIEKASDDADAPMPNRKTARRVSLSGSSTSSSRCPSEEKSSSEESEHEEIATKTSECGMESDRESDTVVKIEKRKPKSKRSNRVTSSNEEEEEEKLMDADNKSDVSDSSDEKSPQDLLDSMKKCVVVVDSDSDNNNVGHASTVSDESESDEEKSSDGSSNEADSCSENTKENLETVDSDVELIAEVKPAEKVNRSVTPDNSALSKNNQRERRVRPVIDKITEELSPSKFGVYGDFIKKETDPTESKMVIDKGVYSPALYDHCYFVYANPPPSPPLTSPATVVQPVVDETSFTVLKSSSSQKKISPSKRSSKNVRDLLNQNRAAVSIAAALTERNSEPNARTFVSSASVLDFSKPSSSKQQATVATAALPILPARPVDVLFKRRDSFNETQILYDFVLNGLDEEDMGFIKRAYETMCTENSVSNEDWIKTTHWSSHVPTATQPPCKKRRILSDEKTVHKTGAARTEGFYRPTDKLKRKFTSASRRAIEEAVIPFNFKADDHAGKQQLQLSREARSNQRRLLSTFGDVDFLKFNQLKYRKKLIKFARSAIHGWGLFALEQIGQDEMIIEYVGEKIRLMVAEKREKHYEKMGIGSSYLFRIDNERVIDATKRGAVARFINHSCNPSCYAKIISLDGEKRIVIYSKQSIAAGEEITYDYKFPFEDVKIPCNCGAHNCRGSLN